MIKICVSGCNGKMGARISNLAKNDPQLKISGEFDIGQDPELFIKNCDCLIEFTTPQATIEHLLLAIRHKRAMVIGTTGLSNTEQEKIKEASTQIPILFSSNMSIGVNLVFRLVADTAKTLDSSYTAKIKEAHHIHKKDAPSGTAKELARIIKALRGNIDIPIEAIRENEIVGDHEIIFEGPLDKIVLSHSAKTRDIFAKGALEAAKFIAKKRKGLFSMKEVLFK